MFNQYFECENPVAASETKEKLISPLTCSECGNCDPEEFEFVEFREYVHTVMVEPNTNVVLIGRSGRDVGAESGRGEAHFRCMAWPEGNEPGDGRCLNVIPATKIPHMYSR